MTVPIKQNVASQFDYIMLFSGTDIITTPTIAAGDFKISVDDGAEANPATLPAEAPAGSGFVKVSFSQAETNGEVIKLRWVDAAGAEWDDGGATWRTSTVVLSDLPTSAAAASASASAGEILVIRGDSMDQDITGLGDITTRTETWFTVKAQLDDADADAIIMISEGTGLEILNGVDVSATRAAEGSITVTNAGTGALTIWVNPTATDELVPSSKRQYDIQWTDATDVTTPAMGRFRVQADATRAVA
jgi:hypothetical protein